MATLEKLRERAGERGGILALLVLFLIQFFLEKPWEDEDEKVIEYLDLRMQWVEDRLSDAQDERMIMLNRLLEEHPEGPSPP